MKIFQSAQLSRDPVSSMEAATKSYVDNQVLSGAIVGGLFFTNISPTSSGIVGSKQYVSGTVPANSVITQATSDTDNVTVTLFAEGGSAFYSPTITITTTPAQAGGPIVASLSVDAANTRAYFATAALTGITANTTINASSSTNASASAAIVRAAVGPAMSAIAIGALPGTQTEAKSGDVVPITGRAENAANYAELISGGANNGVLSLTLGAADSYSPGFKSVSGVFTVGSNTGVQSVSARARNALGTFGTAVPSTNSITLNQTYPTIGARSIAYPSLQSGIKSAESATVSSTITNADTVAYAGTNLSITGPSTYAVSKTVTRTGGAYSFGVNNYTITATKASNAATSVASSAVTIADAAPTAAITINTSPARLFSSAAGTDYTIMISASQQLLNAPSLTTSAGTWQGSWSGAGTTWTRVLRIFDTDTKGSQSFSTLALTGLAGVAGSTITAGSTFTIGGFVTRTISFPAFARFAPIGTHVTTISKVTASYTNSAVLTRQTDTANAFQGFTIVNSSGVYDPIGDYLYVSDEAFAGANTSGTLQLNIAEAV